MAKIITSKMQIPKSQRIKIKNFDKLTDNQAIFEYELNKLLRRAKRAGIKLPPIFRPSRVTKQAIKELSDIRGEALKQYGEKLNKKDWDETADALEQARAFVEGLKQEIINSQNSAIISFSDYRTGRPRNAKSRVWITNNITRATDMLLNKLDSITHTDEELVGFAKHFMENDAELAKLQDAIGEYIRNSYSVMATSSYFTSSTVYQLLIGRPLTLKESQDLSENDEGYEDEE